ncbi:hypothetical protein [Nitrospira moscoviensis]|uniref:Uncharacterized protein n=1 Tax=Nitrospira moscoviensis TaxID=42253 RepID=A0A0K2GF15_NITMO|nr:hypothetical protein [Nitrospira moscoviensis]ALA59546.1 hypothetical protein NITMOv2_3147 [Nitrospira moscoviensis]
MPCWMTATTTVELKAADQRLLKQAAERLGWRASIDKESLRIQTPDGITLFVSAQSVVIPRGQEELVQALQRAYAHQILDTVASQFGWTLESTDTSESNFVLSKF